MPRRSLVALGALILGLSTLAGVYFATQLHFAYPSSYRRSWSDALTINLVHYWIWGLLAPLAVLAGRRWPFSRSHWARTLALHLGVGVALTVAQILLAQGILFALGRASGGLAVALLKGLQVNFHSSFPTYWLILAMVHAADYYAKYRDREVRASQLEARLAEARLAALKRQMNPHFLFNTLNSISELMYSDPDAAEAMIARLSELLRMALDTDGEQEVALSRELEMLSCYLAIETARFEDRLRVVIGVPPDLLGARVPVLSLQPLAENAIRHGLARRADGGTLAVRAERRHDRLHLAVEDDGPGPAPAAEAGDGVGLKNLRARLQQLYGEAHELALIARPQGGAAVEITLPFRLEEADGQAARADRR